MKRFLAGAVCAAMILGLSACAASAPAELPQQENRPSEQPEGTEASLGPRDPITGACPEMQQAEFWIGLDETAGQLRMTAEECAAYNAGLTQTPGTDVEDLSRYGQEITAAAVQELLPGGAAPREGYYTGGTLITAEQRRAIEQNTGLEGFVSHAPQYGFVTRSTLLRRYPSGLPLYLEPDDAEFDQAVETRAKLWEPFVLLHTSADGQWYFVRTRDYAAWLQAADGALCSRERWDSLRQRLEEDFLIVTAPRLSLAGSAALPELAALSPEMGTRLPLEREVALADNAVTGNCWVVQVPLADTEGNLQLARVRIPKSGDAKEGCLPYTGENLLRQAFRLLGQRYGWGGMFGDWDCSSFCQDVYLTLGLRLPRNSGSQSRIPGGIALSGLTEEEKAAALAALQPGTLVVLSGHQTMYLGTYAGEPYLIHATYALYDAAGERYVQNAVIVSSALAFRSNGKTILANSHTLALPAKKSEKTG